MLPSDQLVTNSVVSWPSLDSIIQSKDSQNSLLYLQLHLLQGKGTHFPQRKRCIEQGRGEIHPNMELLVVFPTWSHGEHYVLQATMYNGTVEYCQSGKLIQVCGVQSFYWCSIVYWLHGQPLVSSPSWRLELIPLVSSSYGVVTYVTYLKVPSIIITLLDCPMVKGPRHQRPSREAGCPRSLPVTSQELKTKARPLSI